MREDLQRSAHADPHERQAVQRPYTIADDRVRLRGQEPLQRQARGAQREHQPLRAHQLRLARSPARS